MGVIYYQYILLVHSWHIVHYVDVWDGLQSFQVPHTAITYSNKIDDELPTTFTITQYVIKSKGNQIVSANLPLLEVSTVSKFYYLTNYYVALIVNTMN